MRPPEVEEVQRSLCPLRESGFSIGRSSSRAQQLGDLGAEVIKIEDRVRGDGGRGFTAIMGSSHPRGMPQL